MNIIELLNSKDSETILLGIKMLPFVKFYRYIKETKPGAYKLILFILRNRNCLEFFWQTYNEYYLVRVRKGDWVTLPISVPYLADLYQKFQNENS